jgi:hypothetical protein
VFVLVLTTSFESQALAAKNDFFYSGPPSAPSKVYYLGVGPLSESFGRYANDTTASTTSLTNAVYANVQIQARFPVLDSWIFNPEVSYTPLGVKSPDGGEKFRILTIGTRAAYGLGLLDVHSGPELLIRMVSASGGTIKLNNGTGTSTFALPPKSDSQDLLAWNFGLGARFKQIRIDFDFLVTDFSSSARRALDGLVVMSYGIF